MKRFILFIATMVVTLSPFAAQAYDSDYYTNIDQNLTVNITKNIEENTTVTNRLTLDVDIDADIKIKGSESLGWWKRGITVDGLASAEIKNNQILKLNKVINKENPNNASINKNALRDAKGNIGVNVVAGDNNAQDNLAAIATSERENSMADAMISKEQISLGNFTLNKGRENNATLNEHALENAIGNIGVNLAAGNNNAQSNMLAGAVAPSKVGIAKVGVHQEAAENMTINKPVTVDEVQYIQVDLDLSATLNGSYTGTSDQIGDVYLDTWSGPTHEGGNSTGHIDVDNAVDGAQDLNVDGGAFAFNEKGALSGELIGTVTGDFPVVIHRNVNMVNTASLSDNALRNATGNIGVNIAAGTGNLQANALAITALTSPLPNGGGGE